MNLHTFRPVFWGAAVLGSAVLILVNLATWFGQKSLLEFSLSPMPFVIFLIWAYTIFYLRRTRQLAPEQVGEMGFLGALRHYLAYPPRWLEVILVAIYLYTLYCLFLWVSGAMVDPRYINGQYTVFDHGKVTVYSEAEYQVAHNLHLRAVTGIALTFLFFSAVMLRPVKAPAEV